MGNDIAGTGPTFLWQRAGSFRSYAEATRAAEKTAQSKGLPPSALAIWPVGLKVVEGNGARAANDEFGRWTALGALLGGLFGTALGAANAVVAFIPRPLAVAVSLALTGLFLGTIAGLCIGALVARGVAVDTGTEPLLRATRYDLVVDRAATPGPTAANRRGHPGEVVDLRHPSADRTHRR